MAFYRCGVDFGGGESWPTWSYETGGSGIPTIISGRYTSKISSSNYALTPLTPTGTAPVYNVNKAMRLHLRVKFQYQKSSRVQTIAGPNSSHLQYRPYVECGKGDSTVLFAAGYSTDGSSWASWLQVLKSEMPFVSEQWYDLDYSWDGTTFTFSVNDGTNTISKQATVSKMYDGGVPMLLGKDQNNVKYMEFGSFDLKNCYYEQDGTLLWGNKES